MYSPKGIDYVKIVDELYIRKSCNCTKYENESLFISFKYVKHQYMVGGIYRHPNGNGNHFTIWDKYM